jgi:hypothetical protein
VYGRPLVRLRTHGPRFTPSWREQRRSAATTPAERVGPVGG